MRTHDLRSENALNFPGLEDVVVVEQARGVTSSSVSEGLRDEESGGRQKSAGSKKKKGDDFGRGTSRYRGVSWHKKNRKWSAKLSNKGLSIHLGSFADERKAARAVDLSIQERGLDRTLNFPSNVEDDAVSKSSCEDADAYQKKKSSWRGWNETETTKEKVISRGRKKTSRKMKETKKRQSTQKQLLLPPSV